MRAPIAYTCPDIDAAIKKVNSAIRIGEDAIGYSEKNKWVDAIDDILREIDGVESALEDLRNSNETLRAWGYELLDEIEELKK